MKPLISIFISLLILLISLQKGIIYLHFKLNQDYIESKYCINKNKPELNCKGKCHLMKVMKLTDNKNLPKKLPFYPEIKLFNQAILSFSLDKKFRVTQKNIFLDKKVFYTSKYITRIFHPPIF